MKVDLRDKVDEKWNWCINCKDKTYNTLTDFCWGCGSNSSSSKPVGEVVLENHTIKLIVS